MADHQEASVTLPSEPASVPVARSHVGEVLGKWGLPEAAAACEGVRLIVSELATNAVQHTFGRSPTFTVELRLDRGVELRVGVTDGHPRPPRGLPAPVLQDNGRGLMIIRCLISEWGGRMSVVPTPQGGKTVWITLPWTALPPPEPVAAQVPALTVGPLDPPAGPTTAGPLNR